MGPVCLYYCQEEDAITFPPGAQEQETKGEEEHTHTRSEAHSLEYEAEVRWLSAEQMWTFFFCGCMETFLLTSSKTARRSYHTAR